MLKVSNEEIDNYINFYLDKETNLTKFDYVLLSLIISEIVWNRKSAKP
ncbi:hypothetical protein SJAV_20640 [Sulfurisphaera javensis]|uniref:Uncharacterized protein n=1 Tax=Sulfurisphaera javensis TaxID=2049879 RepID=A0AAT9GTI8_9CREN